MIIKYLARMKFIYVTVLLCFNFTTSRSGEFRVIGPSLPLIAGIGEDLILPCSLQPNISAVDMTVDWFRVDQAESTVHLFTNHEDENKDQAVSYSGRTALFKEELQKGNTSLKLSEVQVSDAGIYKCLVKSESWHDDVTLVISVEAPGRDPVITVEEPVVSGGVRLVCESKGWSPEPEVVWLDSEGEALTAEATEMHKGSEGFSVKCHVTVYNSDSNRFFCRVKYGRHMKQTEVIISDKCFSKWRISVIFNFLLLSSILMGLIGSVICVYCRRKGRQRIYHEIESSRRHKVTVTMDASTAHPYLNLSEDGKAVRYGKKHEDYRDGPNNFDDFAFVLGKEGYEKSFYFEVQVRGKTHWTIGVARESIKKKGEITRKPKYGFWTLRKKLKRYSPRPTVFLWQEPQTVGVFVDYEAGVVVFYDVGAMSVIYSFTKQVFSEKLFPIFSPGLKHDGMNETPLIITDVPNRHTTDEYKQSVDDDDDDQSCTVNWWSE